LETLGLFRFVGCYHEEILYCGRCIRSSQVHNKSGKCEYVCGPKEGQVRVDFNLNKLRFAPYPEDLLKELEFRKSLEWLNQQRDARVEKRRQVKKKTRKAACRRLTPKQMEQLIAEDDRQQKREEATEKASIVKKLKNDPIKMRCKAGINRINAACENLLWKLDLSAITRNLYEGINSTDGTTKIYSCRDKNCKSRFSTLADYNKHINAYHVKM
jgi:hypothetical protein